MAERVADDQTADPTDAPPVAPAARLMGGIAGAALLLMLGSILSRLLGLGREMMSSYYFGLSVEMNAFTIADNVRTMLFDLLISGMISAALIPVLSEYAAPERRAELRRVLGTLLALALLIGGGIVGLLMLFAPTVVTVMTGLVESGEDATYDLALMVTLVRAILPSVLLLGLSAILLAALQSLRRFSVYSLSLLAPNAALIGTVVVLHGAFGLGIISMVLGTVLGAALLVGLGLAGLRGALPTPSFQPAHPAVRRIGALYLPIFLGLIVSTIALVLDRNFATTLGHEAIPAMRYATQVQQMALGLVASAIAVAALPALSQAATTDLAAFRRTLGTSLRLILVLVIPATLGLLALSAPVVTLLFQQGATTEQDAALITLALLCYLPGLPFAAIDQILIFAYYARRDTRTPVIVGVVAIGFYLLTALALLRPLGMAGLVLANSAQFISHGLIMLWLARRSLGSLASERLGRAALFALLASLPMAGVAFGLAALLAPWPGLTGEIARVALPAGAGALVYVALLRLFGVDDLAHVGRLLLRKIGRA